MAIPQETLNINPQFKNGDLIKEQEDLLQCPICIDRLENPKDLLCNHTFCKGCLDDLLQFDDDGSAIIHCPMKCKPANYIDKSMTTNDLKTSYHLKSMLDWFDTKESKETPTTNELKCQGEDECTNSISVYCSTCSLIMCQPCQVKHTLTQGGNAPGRSYIPIKFNKKKGTTVTMCKKHNTLAKYICCEKEFICVYCKERRHQGHLSELTEVISNQIQTEIITMEKNVKGRTEQIQKGVQNALEATEAAINEGRILLKKLIAKQKLACMSEYYTLLQTEEGRLLSEYNDVTTNHLELYKWNHSRDTFLNLTDKLPFQFIHEEEKLFEHMLERSFGVEVPLLTIGKRDAVYDAGNPLGNITLNVTENVVINHESVDVSSITVNMPDDGKKDVSLTFLDDLANLVVEENIEREESVEEEREDIEINAPDTLKDIENESEEKENNDDKQQYEPFDRGNLTPSPLFEDDSVPTSTQPPESDDVNNDESRTTTTDDTTPVGSPKIMQSAKKEESIAEPHNFTRASCQLISVELLKSSYQDFGIYLSGEDNAKGGVIICDIEKGSPAYKKLKIGDRIITINGLMLSGGVEQNILQQINTAGNKITLGIKRSCTNFVSYN